MENLSDMENHLREINHQLSGSDFTQEFVNIQGLLNKRKELAEKISQLKWVKLSLKEKILKRKEDFSLTSKHFDKFKEEVEQKYLFKEKYIRLVDIIESSTSNSPLLNILLRSLNSSMYVNFAHKESNTPFIVDELEKINSPQLLEIISLFKEITSSHKPI